MKWFRKETPSSRTYRMLAGRAALSDSRMSPARVQAEINHLIELSGRNRNIKELSGNPGWLELEADLSQRCLHKLRNLPRLLMENKIETAKADAAYIEWSNQVLGMVNETLLESARVAQLINTKIAVQERFNEETQPG